MSNQPQVLIVGGGVFGSCCAYELAKAGASFTVVERDPIGFPRLGRNPGNLNPILATPAKLRPLALASFSMHLQMDAELTHIGCTDHKLSEVRRILVCFNEMDRRQLMPVLQLFKDQPGFSASWVEAQELRRIGPRLSRDVESGLLITGNRSLDALAFRQSDPQGRQEARRPPVHRGCQGNHAELAMLYRAYRPRQPGLRYARARQRSLGRRRVELAGHRTAHHTH